MPQLDFSIFPSQFFWLCVCFFSMLFIMSKIIIPRIAEMIELRREKIDGNLEKISDRNHIIRLGRRKYGSHDVRSRRRPVI